MRLDKFLKVTGVVRRRTVANDLATAGRISIDERAARPASEVRPGCRIRIDFGRKVVTYEVLDVPLREPRKDEAERYVRLLDERIREDW
jgi:ribosomal 50S subunit-recycling heat shock protein